MKKLIAMCGTMAIVMNSAGMVATVQANPMIFFMPQYGQTTQFMQMPQTVQMQTMSVITEEVADEEKLIYAPTVDVENMFSNRDSNIEYDTSTATKIQLSNQTVTISEAGVYILSGSLDDAQVIIDADRDNDKIQLVLDGVTMNCNTSAPIYVKSADKVFITLAENTINQITVGGEFADDEDNNVDGAIFSKSDITFNGLGTLIVSDAYGNGIVGKDDVVFAGGTYTIIAAEHGIDANDSVRIKDGSINITSTKDGIHVDDDDTTKGFFYMQGGTLTIDALQDAISASGTLRIDGGTLALSSGGGYEKVLNTITLGEGKGNTVQVTDTLEYSMKAVKGGNITINGGELAISAYEDALHSNSDFTINGGVIYIISGDDAVHADDLLTINDVDLTVESAYEGLEGSSITINGGTIFASVLDDAINSSASTGVLVINGGSIHLEATGDGVDSNGAFTMTGGELVLDVKAVYSGGDGNIDVDGVVTYTGGTIVDVDGNAIDPTISLMGGRNIGMSMGNQMGQMKMPERF